MLIWIVALLAGAAATVFVYGTHPTSRALLPAGLRFVGVSGLLALLLNATFGGQRAARPLIALDVSRSWVRTDSTLFHDAVRRAESESDGSILIFGDSARLVRGAIGATDQTSRIKPAVDRAVATGRPLHVFTDGEIDDPQALAAAPGGSSVTVIRSDSVVDVAVAELRTSRSVAEGDTLDVDVVITTAGRPAPRGSLSLAIGDASAVSFPLDSIPAWSERISRQRMIVPRGKGSLVLRGAVAVSGDAVSANDSLSAVVEVLAGAAAVLVSTSPDYDARSLAAVLRGTVMLPTRVYYRVTPGRWLQDGSSDVVSEEEVRRAARDAPLLILHADTAVFGDPRSLSSGALLLVAPPTVSTGEWYATGAPPSPMSTALAGSPWDSLPPLEVAAVTGSASFEILETRRLRRLERRPAALGWDGSRRTVLVPSAGFWRWRFRGGAAASLHSAFWGSIIDWLAAEQMRTRSISSTAASVREGEPIRWRRGGGTPDDSLVPVVLMRRGSMVADTISLRFPKGMLYAESRSPVLGAGVYDVSVPDDSGRSLLVVNPSAELLPRRPVVQDGNIGAGVALTEAPRLRVLGWFFAMVILAFCGEWILRRRIGLR